MKSNKPDRYSDEAEIVRLQSTATKILGFTFDRIIRSGSEENLVGIQSEHLMLSRRLDSRTYFVQDIRYQHDSEDGSYTGPDQTLLRTCRTILKKLAIPVAEISDEAVLKEHSQVGEFNGKT